MIDSSGGELVSPPLEPVIHRLVGAVMSRTVIGTAHFKTIVDVFSYYERTHSVNQIARKIRAGDVHIGPPPLELGEFDRYLDEDQRYHLVITPEWRGNNWANWVIQFPSISYEGAMCWIGEHITTGTFRTLCMEHASRYATEESAKAVLQHLIISPDMAALAPRLREAEVVCI